MDGRRSHKRLTLLLDEQGSRLYAALARLTPGRDLAAELFQELFLRLARSATFATADDPDRFAWRTAINLAMEWRRGRDRRPVQHPENYVREPESAEVSPLETLIHREQVERVLDALSELSESMRECFVLRLIEQQPYEQIARQLGKTPHQVRGLCHAAIRNVRERLNANHRTPADAKAGGHD